MRVVLRPFYLMRSFLLADELELRSPCSPSRPSASHTHGAQQTARAAKPSAAPSTLALPLSTAPTLHDEEREAHQQRVTRLDHQENELAAHHSKAAHHSAMAEVARDEARRGEAAREEARQKVRRDGKRRGDDRDPSSISGWMTLRALAQ